MVESGVALKNRCQACDFVIEAPDVMRGQEVVCPQCAATNILRSPEDAQLAIAEAALARARERQRFLDGLGKTASGNAGRPSGCGPVSGSGSSVSRVAGSSANLTGLHGGGLAALAGQRLKDVSTYLLAGAYIHLAAAITLGVAFAAGSTATFAWKLFGVLAGSLVGLGLFLFLKFLSDALRALADLADLGRSIDARLERLEPIERVSQAAPGADRPVQVAERAAPPPQVAER